MEGRVGNGSPELDQAQLWVHRLAFSPDSRCLAVAGDGLKSELSVLEVATGQLVRTLVGHTDLIVGVAFSPDGRWLASGSHDHTIRVWEAATGRPVQTLTARDWVSAVALSPDGRRLATASGDKRVALWDIPTGRELRVLTGHIEIVWDIVFSPDGRWLASGSQDDTVKLWAVASGREVRTLGHARKSVPE